MPHSRFDVCVVGGGPAGLTLVGGALDNNKSVLWIDESGFTGGRLQELYREVPRFTDKQ